MQVWQELLEKRRRTAESLAIGLGKGSVSKAKGSLGKNSGELSLGKKTRKPRASMTSMDLRAFTAEVEGKELPDVSASAPVGRFESATPSVLSARDDDLPSPNPASGSQSTNADGPAADMVARREEEEESSAHEEQNHEEPQAKRRRLSSPPTESESASASASAGPSSQPAPTQKTRSYKKKPLNPDAQAYKPSADEEEESSEEEDSKSGKKKSPSKKRRSIIIPGTPSIPGDPASASAVDSVAPSPSGSVGPSVDVSDVAGDTPTAPSQERPVKAKRSKRRPIHRDSAAYKPEKDGEDEEVDSDSEEPEEPKTRRSKADAGKRGQKRKKAGDEEANGDASINDEQGPKTKKTRTRKSTVPPTTSLEVAGSKSEQT